MRAVTPASAGGPAQAPRRRRPRAGPRRAPAAVCLPVGTSCRRAACVARPSATEQAEAQWGRARARASTACGRHARRTAGTARRTPPVSASAPCHASSRVRDADAAASASALGLPAKSTLRPGQRARAALALRAGAALKQQHRRAAPQWRWRCTRPRTEVERMRS